MPLHKIRATFLYVHMYMICVKKKVKIDHSLTDNVSIDNTLILLMPMRSAYDQIEMPITDFT